MSGVRPTGSAGGMAAGCLLPRALPIARLLRESAPARDVRKGRIPRAARASRSPCPLITCFLLAWTLGVRVRLRCRARSCVRARPCQTDFLIASGSSTKAFELAICARRCAAAALPNLRLPRRAVAPCGATRKNSVRNACGRNRRVLYGTSSAVADRDRLRVRRARRWPRGCSEPQAASKGGVRHRAARHALRRVRDPHDAQPLGATTSRTRCSTCSSSASTRCCAIRLLDRRRRAPAPRRSSTRTLTPSFVTGTPPTCTHARPARARGWSRSDVHAWCNPALRLRRHRLRQPARLRPASYGRRHRACTASARRRAGGGVDGRTYATTRRARALSTRPRSRGCSPRGSVWPRRRRWRRAQRRQRAGAQHRRIVRRGGEGLSPRRRRSARGHAHAAAPLRSSRRTTARARLRRRGEGGGRRAHCVRHHWYLNWAAPAGTRLAEMHRRACHEAAASMSGVRPPACRWSSASFARGRIDEPLDLRDAATRPAATASSSPSSAKLASVGGAFYWSAGWLGPAPTDAAPAGSARAPAPLLRAAAYAAWSLLEMAHEAIIAWTPRASSARATACSTSLE